MACKCRIVSDGSPRGTKIFDASGVELDLPITSICIEVNPGKPVIATVRLIATHLDIVGEQVEDWRKLNG